MPGAPEDDLLAEVHEGLQHLAQAHQFRAPPVQGQHVDAERGLKLREAEELVQDHVRRGVALELNHHPHALTIALVTKVCDAFHPLVPDKFGDPLDQNRLVHLVGNGGDDDGFAFLADLFDGRNPTHDHGSPASHQGGAGARPAHDLSARREVGTWDHVEKVIQRNVRSIDQGQGGVGDFAKIVRGNIGGHAHSDAAGAIDQEIGDTRRQDDRLLLLAVIVVLEVDSIEVKVRQQGGRGPGHPAFGVPHLGRGIAVNRSEVALAVHKQQAHREGLGHADKGVIDRLVAVRVQARQDVAHHAGGLGIGTVRAHAQVVHREQDPPVDRLEAVTDIRKRTADDHAHGIVEVRAAQLVLDGDRHNAGRASVFGRGGADGAQGRFLPLESGRK